MRTKIFIKNKNKFFLFKLKVCTFFYTLVLKFCIGGYIQRRYLASFLRYISHNNKYYTSFLAGHIINSKNCIDILRTLPLLTKEMIQQQGNNIYDSTIGNSHQNWRNTGGSTGEPLRFPVLYKKRVFPDEELIQQAYLYQLMGCSIQESIIEIDGVRVPESKRQNNIYWAENTSNFPYGKKRYSILYLNENTFRYYVKSMNNDNPVILRGYPSAVKHFCQLLESTNEKITFTLKAVYLTSENFDENMANYISQILGCDVWGQYGHTEISIFAFKRPHESKYLCCPFYGFTEILDSNEKQVKKGEIGEIVVTGFTNIGLPFVRYKTGDLAVFGGKTKNGSVIIENLLGRSTDYIFDKKSNKIYLVGFIFGGHLSAFNDIKEWQIIQKEIGKLSIHIVKGKTYTQNSENELLSLFTNNNFDVQISYTDHLEKTQRGKQKFLIQELQ